MREPPLLMATQHPDSTVKVSVQEEVGEAIQAYTLFGCDEVMVDYEGKLTPYAQPKEIVCKAVELGLPVGEGFFLTPRLPNPTLEEWERTMLSLEAALLANYYSRRLAGADAVRWVVLPMVEDVDTVRLVRRVLERKAAVYREELGTPSPPAQLVPLLEDARALLEAERYVRAVAAGGEVRVFLGKSDAAVKSGHVASSLALAYALSELYRLEREEGVKVCPILGMGSPPFRGGLNNPSLAQIEARQYSGYWTATVQSAVRYDATYGEFLKVREAVKGGARGKPRGVGPEAVELARRAESSYRAFVARYLEAVGRVAQHVPQTRERVPWREYGRALKLDDRLLSVPRAIVFTAAWYTLGVPPTLLDAPFIAELSERGRLDELLDLLPALRLEWEYDARFYVPGVARRRLGDELVEVVNRALDAMGVQAEPDDTYARTLALNPVEEQVIAAARLRGFLG